MSQFPDTWAVFLLSMLPVTELRASLPLALTTFGMAPFEGWLYSVLGNAVPLIIMFLLFEPLYAWAQKRIPKLGEWVERFVESRKKKHKKRYEEIGLAILILLVAIPLPGTGVWTGSLLAVVFKMNRTRAAIAILAGLLIASGIVLGLTTGIIHLF